MNAPTSNLAERLDTAAAEATDGVVLDNPTDVASRGSNTPGWRTPNPAALALAVLVVAAIAGAVYLWSVGPDATTSVDTVDSVDIVDTDAELDSEPIPSELDQGTLLIVPEILTWREEMRVITLTNDDEETLVELKVDPAGEQGICFDVTLPDGSGSGGCTLLAWANIRTTLQAAGSLGDSDESHMVFAESPDYEVAVGLLPPGAVWARLEQQETIEAEASRTMHIAGGVYIAYSDSGPIGDVIFDWAPGWRGLLDRCFGPSPTEAECVNGGVPGWAPIYAQMAWPFPETDPVEVIDPALFGQPQPLVETLATVDVPEPPLAGPIFRSAVADTGVNVFWWYELDPQPGVGIRTCMYAITSGTPGPANAAHHCFAGIGNAEPQSLHLSDGRTVHFVGGIRSTTVVATSGDATAVQQPALEFGAMVLPSGPVEFTYYDELGEVINDS